MNKVLTISIAAYNVEKYVEKALQSLIIKNVDRLEILVQDDGSKDNTSVIAKKYEEMYPNSIKVVKKENGGYGSTINKSIKMATGKYFKQLDGDDWYDTTNLELLINELEKADVDIIYNPYFYFFEKNENKKLNDIFFDLNTGEYFLEDIINKINDTLYMPYLTFKTKLLKENKIELIEKTFYTDTEFILYPLIYSKKIYLSKLPIYYYRIGREGQSISLEGGRKYFRDHLKVEDELLKKIYLIEECSLNVKEYILNNIVKICINSVSRYLMTLPPSFEILKLLKNRENKLRKNSYIIFKKMESNRTVFLLRKTHYLLYPVLCCIKIYKMKKSHQ